MLGAVLALVIGHVWISFNSILQGDHAGVEICTDAHTSQFQSYGLLSAANRLVAPRPLTSRVCLEGLVIDAYFCVSNEKVQTRNDDSVAYLSYKTAYLGRRLKMCFVKMRGK